MPIEPSDFRDSNGEFAPPWARFPDYERYTIGWRMGIGESYLGWWWAFVRDEVGPTEQDRLAYLKRHPAAPFTWWETAWNVWRPSSSDNDDEKSARMAALLDAALIAEDVAYPTWRKRDDSPPPWENHEDPVEAARYSTRDLWFWSRRLREPGGEVWLERVPVHWHSFPPQPSEGLRSLASMLMEGALAGPWTLGMEPGDAQDSYALDMNFVDAFRLWMDSAFDDRPHLDRQLRTLGLPGGPWTDWVEEAVFLD